MRSERPHVRTTDKRSRQGFIKALASAYLFLNGKAHGGKSKSTYGSVRGDRSKRAPSTISNLLEKYDICYFLGPRNPTARVTHLSLPCACGLGTHTRAPSCNSGRVSPAEAVAALLSIAFDPKPLAPPAYDWILFISCLHLRAASSSGLAD